MFETTGTVNKEFYQKIQPTVFKKRRRVVIVGLIIFAFAVLAAFLGGEVKVAQMSLVCIAIVAVFGYFGEWNWVSVNMSNIRDATAGGYENTFTTRFTKEGIEVYNHGTEVTTNYPYEDITSYAQDKHVIILHSKTQELILAFLDELSEKEQLKLEEFIKSQPTKIKWTPIETIQTLRKFK